MNLPSSQHAYRGAPVARAVITLWGTHVPRFMMALVGWSLPLPLAGGLYLGWLGSDSFFGWTGFWVALVPGWFTTGMITLLVLVVKADAPGAGFLKKPLHHIELFDHSVTLRDATGAVVGDLSSGTLRVARANVQPGRVMFGAIRLDHAGGSIHVLRHQPIGPWNGMVVSLAPGLLHHIDDAFFDALLRFAA